MVHLSQLGGESEGSGNIGGLCRVRMRVSKSVCECISWVSLCMCMCISVANVYICADRGITWCTPGQTYPRPQESYPPVADG